MTYLLRLALLCTVASVGELSARTMEVYPFTGETVSVGAPMIMGEGRAGLEQLVSFFMESNPEADQSRVRMLASLYLEECAIEGVNWDVAFVQMCLETGFLRFGGLVTEGMNNFCGLGATGPDSRGHTFPDAGTGVRAHVQHLKAYGSTEPLVGECVDPRFHFVDPRGMSPDVAGLSGTWAADGQYGRKLTDLLEALYSRTSPAASE
ncbi:MAG: glucosaminidase domain-containing protein [Candidatus Aegiribacteria sp.]